MSLEEYKKKRNFNKSPEPINSEVQTDLSLRRFVIQKHDASHLHYDFRLESEGVLKSWAIPKGPSANPKDKRLAIQVEDHPIEYINFEGIIPEGNYGAGTVMVWDQGNYTILNSENTEKALKKGHLEFVLNGEKLKGGFDLVELTGKENEWLLIKKKDNYANQKFTDDISVVSGRNMLEIKQNAKNKCEIWFSKTKFNSLPKTEMPHNIKPMLADTADSPFNSKSWIFEMKLDGYRAIAEIEDAKVQFYSRRNLPYSEKFSEIYNELKKINFPVILDGEIIVTDDQGKPNFQLVQNYSKTHQGHLGYYVFDILYLNGRDLTKLPLFDRKEILRNVFANLNLNLIKYMGYIPEKGISFFEASTKFGLEGIMAKKSDSIYFPGQRTKDWLKIKLTKSRDVIIIGFTKDKGQFFGSLLTAVYQNKKLVYTGNVGTGFNTESARDLYSLLKKIEKNKPTVGEVPGRPAEIHWVEPKLVAEVKYTEITQEGYMRHPVFLRLRDDITPQDLYNGNKMAKKNPNEKGTNLSNLNKIYWPDEGYTKGDLINYYENIAPYILPYLKDRPLSLKRNPNGIKGESFYQKNFDLPHPDWLETHQIKSETGNEIINYVLCQNKNSLIYLANLGCIEFNPWNSRIGSLKKPDYIVIDLDPGEKIKFKYVVETAKAVKKVLDRAKIIAFPKTSGASGLHIYIPISAKYSYSQVRSFGKLIALLASKEYPKYTSVERSPEKRINKIYIDYLQNSLGQTLASAYSIRPVPGAQVSAPLKWEELNSRLSPSNFTIKNIFERIEKVGDLFSPILTAENDIKKAIEILSSTRL